MNNPPSLDDLRRTAARRLVLISDSPDLEARRLLEHTTGLSGARLIIEAHRILSAPEHSCFEKSLARRMGGEPLAYIVGHIGFYDLDLQITPDVLVPRSDTETLVEAALVRLPAEAELNVADLGTGSGAIALALAAARPRWRLLGTDASPAALACARGNAERLAIGNAQFAAGSWLAPLPGTPFDAIVSNPPYIDTADPHLTDPALGYEPRSALVADDHGLADIAHIVEHAPRHLKSGGLLLIEHGHEQGKHARRLFEAAGLYHIVTLADLAGTPRATLGYTAE